MKLEDSNLTILKNILEDADKCDYKGYSKHDALLSPILLFFFGKIKILRLLAIQFVMRFPVNIRKYLFVPKTINPKGLGLFAHANLNLYKLTNDNMFLERTVKLLEKLIEISNSNYGGMSWGYQYPWQDVGFFAPANMSNRVVTCWIGFSFAQAYLLLGKKQYREVVNKIGIFLSTAPNRIVDTKDEICFSYVPDKQVNWAVMDVSALTAKMFLLIDKCNGDNSYQDMAERCMHYVINRQTEYGAWFYTDPPKDSHITHDNYHTGIILDTIYDYMKLSNNWEYENVYLKGLDYYKRNLFCEDGAPKWMNNKIYPHDIHGSAQGVITFSKASEKYLEYSSIAYKILNWTNDNMLAKNGSGYYYQKMQIYKKRFTLLRWCNAWMSYAISDYLLKSMEIDL